MARNSSTSTSPTDREAASAGEERDALSRGTRRRRLVGGSAADNVSARQVELARQVMRRARRRAGR